MNNKIYKKLFVGFGFVIIVLILTLFVMSQTYIQNLVYHERLSQMEEVTHQMFHSLEDVIDNHWDEVDVQCNYLYYTPLETDTDLYRYLKKLSELSNYHEKQIELIAVDAAGRYYTEYGRTGLLREMNYLENAPQRVSYVSNSLTVDDSRMVFLEQLSTPITLQSGEKEITLRYFGISQSMTQLNDYFRCDAYENNNSVYVLDNNGFKLFNANDTELLKGHNVYTVLSQMSYLHGSSFAVAKERLARTGSCYSNAVLDGTEYYYALKQMENAQWTLAFLVPAEYVAVNTQKLVNIVMAVIVGFATVFSIMAVIAGWFLLREKQQRELQAEKKTNLRLEQYNVQLTQANDEMRRAQDAAAEALQSAERASKAKTDFLSNMSHDIRTPMNAIMGMATIAKAHVDERERILDCMEKINGASKLLLSLINEVLDMSKIESGRLILSEDEFNVGELLQDLVVMMQPEIKNKQQTLNIHVKNLRHENVKGDTQRIKQVLMNILSNAIKYTPENGRITIEIYEKDPHNGIGNYQFVFEDNGRGMKPEFLDKIFEPFERASDDEIKRIQGTGLGMSISHKIIQMMGGDIKVESEYGKGSRFTIDMPLVCRDQKPDDKIEVEGLEVLVVDDDKIACLNTSSCLREIGINSECVYSGSEAIEKVRQHHLAEKGIFKSMIAEKEYFAVIIDLKMPQMNGIETTRQIRRFVGADVPIIILSAYDLEEYEAEAKEVKAYGVITKPLYKSKLLQVLRSFLDEGDQPEPIRPFKLSNVDYSGKRILLVEDNELNREIAVEIIGSTGITIDTAINGLDAVHKVAQSEEGFYQIILMDIQMPIMDGYEATRQIRSLQRRDIAHMPIIAMTANAFSEDVTNAIKAGMNYHLAKPIDIGALMGILSKYLQAPA